VPRPIESIKANASEDDGTLYSKTSSQRCSGAEESEVRKTDKRCQSNANGQYVLRELWDILAVQDVCPSRGLSRLVGLSVSSPKL